MFNVETGEAPAVAAGLPMFFLLFTGYSMLRPVRGSMCVASGVENVPWLFTVTFLASLAALPSVWLSGLRSFPAYSPAREQAIADRSLNLKE